MLTIREVARRVGVHPMTIRRWWYAGLTPPPVRIRKTLRWREDEVERWLKSMPGADAGNGTQHPTQAASRRGSR